MKKRKKIPYPHTSISWHQFTPSLNLPSMCPVYIFIKEECDKFLLRPIRHVREAFHGQMGHHHLCAENYSLAIIPCKRGGWEKLGERKKGLKAYVRGERLIVGRIKRKGWCGSSSFVCRNHSGANYSLQTER